MLDFFPSLHNPHITHIPLPSAIYPSLNLSIIFTQTLPSLEGTLGLATLLI